MGGLDLAGNSSAVVAVVVAAVVVRGLAGLLGSRRVARVSWGLAIIEQQLSIIEQQLSIIEQHQLSIIEQQNIWGSLFGWGNKKKIETK